MKLSASFLLALNVSIAPGLIIGVGSGFSVPAYADTLPTITVTPCPSGGVPIFEGDDYYCGDPGSFLGGGSGASSIGSGGGAIGVSMPTPVQQAHLEKCATAYGSYNRHQGANPAYTTKFSNQYGWYAKNAGGAEVDWQATASGRQPIRAPTCLGKIWLQNDGTTFQTTSSCNGTTWAGNTTIIWTSAYSSDARMVNVLAHEFAHQWGADETNATYVGNTAQSAFQNDHGEKCW